MAGWMVVARQGATLRVASGPYARVHGVDRRFASGERMADEQLAQGFGVDPSPPEGCVKATPSATMRRLEAQVNGEGTAESALRMASVSSKRASALR